MTGCRLVVGGVDLQKEYGLVLTDESEVSPPKLKRYETDVPGGGAIDLTDALSGDAAFAPREMSLVLALDVDGGFERVKTSLSSLLHGRRLDFRLTSDPDYTYTGRFEIDEYYCKMHAGRIKVGVRADPYKLLKTCAYRVNAAGGIVVTLESGRMPVCPVFEFSSETIVAAGDVYARMQPGTYRVNDLWLREGVNEVYLNSYLGPGNVPMSRYASSAIEDCRTRRVSDLMWEGIRGGAVLIGDWELDTVAMHEGTLLIEAQHAVSADSERYAVYIEYDWKDL